MKRTAYTYSLMKSARLAGAPFEWIRIWLKKSAKNYKYKYYPIVLTYSGKAGHYLEKKFRSYAELMAYLKVSALTQ